MFGFFFQYAHCSSIWLVSRMSTIFGWTQIKDVQTCSNIWTYVSDFYGPIIWTVRKTDTANQQNQWRVGLMLFFSLNLFRWPNGMTYLTYAYPSYHLESRWRNSNVLLNHYPLQIQVFGSGDRHLLSLRCHRKMGVSKNRGKAPKMDGENNGKNSLKWMIWGILPTIFGSTSKKSNTSLEA